MRTTDYPNLDKMFIERRSPYAFSQEELDVEEVKTLFEAARWSPSSYNEQPWRFIYAQNANDLETFNNVLMEPNQAWASKAPLLILVFTKKHFSQNGKVNPWAQFDAGAATMALILQAHKRGLHAHVMGGFYADKAFEVSGMNNDEYEAIAAIAVGKADESIEQELSQRNYISEFVFENRV